MWVLEKIRTIENQHEYHTLGGFDGMAVGNTPGFGFLVCRFPSRGSGSAEEKSGRFSRSVP